MKKVLFLIKPLWIGIITCWEGHPRGTDFEKCAEKTAMGGGDRAEIPVPSKIKMSRNHNGEAMA